MCDTTGHVWPVTPHADEIMISTSIIQVICDVLGYTKSQYAARVSPICVYTNCQT